ncbi:Meiotic nuclear division protein 1 [Paramarasmius palmivorus]|uniref:Meiotic nuclear division protein 1 n=1 Tax=Paramarasmius palmivorus TaxID=297713 RepID=A0AAW0D005_9AGAR
MAPRGLSAEEKRTRLVEFFHETKDFYQLKELEKLAPKHKGIVAQSVKEVLQSLVDDGLVQMDKIGSSNFFWSFPSQQGALIQNRLNAAKEVQATNEMQLQEVMAAIEAEKSNRQDSEGRTKSLNEIAELKKQVCKLDEELNAYGACDPVKLEETKRAIILAKEAALRWTDNWGVLLSYFTRQTGTPAEDIRKHFGVEEDYEDIY